MPQLSEDVTPVKVKDQVLLIFRYAGMKASVMMNEYLLSTPLVMTSPSVRTDAINF